MHEIPRDELLSAYLDGELTADQRADVERLLAEQPESRQLLEELRALGDGLRALPRVPLEEDFCERVLRRAERKMLVESGPADAPRDSGASSAAAPATTPRRDAAPAALPGDLPGNAEQPWKRRVARALFWPVIAASVALVLANLRDGPEKAGQRRPVVVATNESNGMGGGSGMAAPGAPGDSNLEFRSAGAAGGAEGVEPQGNVFRKSQLDQLGGQAPSFDKKDGLAAQMEREAAEQFGRTGRQLESLKMQREVAAAELLALGDVPIERTYQIASRDSVADLLSKHGIALVDQEPGLDPAAFSRRLRRNRQEFSFSESSDTPEAADKRLQEGREDASSPPDSASNSATDANGVADDVDGDEQLADKATRGGEIEVAGRALESFEKKWAVQQLAVQDDGRIVPETAQGEDWVYIETTPEQLALLLADLETQPDVFFLLAVDEKAKQPLDESLEDQSQFAGGEGPPAGRGGGEGAGALPAEKPDEESGIQDEAGLPDGESRDKAESPDETTLTLKQEQRGVAVRYSLPPAENEALREATGTFDRETDSATDSAPSPPVPAPDAPPEAPSDDPSGALPAEPPADPAPKLATPPASTPAPGPAPQQLEAEVAAETASVDELAHAESLLRASESQPRRVRALLVFRFVPSEQPSPAKPAAPAEPESPAEPE